MSLTLANKPKASVVVPTYNRCHTWRQNDNLLAMLLSQTYENTEIIIVNDGSNDETPHILDNLKKNYPQIIIVNKPNGGLSSARNAGMKVATGDYLFFVDDDDAIPSDYIENLMTSDLADVDLVVDSYSRQIDAGVPVPVHFPKASFGNKAEALAYLFGEMQRYPYCFFAHGKRFRADIIRNNDIRFSETITFVEDRPFVLDFLRHCDKVAITDTHGYIVKSVSETGYRLSSGRKPLDYLCRNIKASYEYLVAYSRETGLESVTVYADNYLVDKIYNYILKPFSADRLPANCRMIDDTFKPLLKLVNWEGIRLSESKCVTVSVLCGGVFGAVND